MGKLSFIALPGIFVLSGTLGVLAADALQSQPKPGVPKEVFVQAASTTPGTAASGPPISPKTAGRIPAIAVGSRGRATLQLDHVPLAAYIVTAKESPRAVDLTSTPVRLTPGALLITKSAEKAVLAPGPGFPAFDPARRPSTRLLLPFQMHFIEQSGEVRSTRVVAQIAGGGLRVVGRGMTFLGLLYVVLEDAIDRTASYSLPQPAEFLVTASVDSVSPDIFEIDRTNHWKSVKLEAAHPKDPVTVRIHVSSDKMGLQFDIPVLRPHLTLLVNPPRINGLGLETAIITVMADGLRDSLGRGVTLSASQGRLGTTQLELARTGIASTEIRSTGIGRTTIEAASPPLIAAKSNDLEFDWPIWFLVAAISGGAIGAVLRRVQARRRSVLHRRRLTSDLAIGALSGFVVAVLYAIGVNVFHVTLTAISGEALVFGLAVLGGFSGFRSPSTLQ